MTTSHTAANVLALLSGRSSQYPMPFDELHAATGLSKKRLKEMLDAMAYALPATINRATLTKGGVTQVVLWPTGVIETRTRMGIVIKPAYQSHPPRMNDLTRAVLDKVISTPGISRIDLLAYGMSTMTKDDTQKVKTAIGNLQHKQLIVSSGGKRNSVTYSAAGAV